MIFSLYLWPVFFDDQTINSSDFVSYLTNMNRVVELDVRLSNQL